jgi:hypothetical protein
MEIPKHNFKSKGLPNINKFLADLNRFGNISRKENGLL